MSLKSKDEIIKMLLENPDLTAGELAATFSVTAKTINVILLLLRGVKPPHP